MERREIRQIFLCQPKQTHRGRQTPAVLRVGRMLEVLLQMNEGASGLNQSFEILGVGRARVEPKLFQHIVRLIVLLLVPAIKKRTIIRVFFHLWLIRLHLFSSRVGQPL